MQIWIECGVVFLVAAFITMFATPLARKIAVYFDAIDYPDNRRVNKTPIPRMGGVAMYVGLVASCIAIIIGVQYFGWVNPFRSPLGMHVNYWLVGLGVTFMFIVGAIDDVRGMKPWVKFLGQIIATSIIASSGLLLSNIQNPFVEGEFIQFDIWAYPITVIYLVCFANVINLIDGLDGLASGISAISAATIFAFSFFAGRVDAAILCIIIIGVCIGFLHYNHHPASIFMGDSGSLLLGLGLGIVSLVAIARSTLIISLLVPILAAGVPITDTAVAIIRRLRAHQRIDAPDKGHIHHRLLNAGFSQDKTVVIMWLWTAALAVCSIVLAESDGPLRAVAIILAAIITGYAIRKLRLLEPVLAHYYSPRKRSAANDGPHEEPTDGKSANDSSAEEVFGPEGDSDEDDDPDAAKLPDTGLDLDEDKLPDAGLGQSIGQSTDSGIHPANPSKESNAGEHENASSVKDGPQDPC